MRTSGTSTTGRGPSKQSLLSVPCTSTSGQGNSPTASPKQSPKASPKSSPRHAGYHATEPSRITGGSTSVPMRSRIAGTSPIPNRKPGLAETPSEKRIAPGDRHSPRPRVQQSVASKSTQGLSEEQLAHALSSLSVAESDSRQNHITPRNDGVQRQIAEPQGIPSQSASSRRRLSRGTSVAPYVPGSSGNSDPIANNEDLDEIQSSLPSDLKPYEPAEVNYMGPAAARISSGSKLRMIAFDFDQTLATTHLFFRLKNVQKRETSKQGGNRPLVDILLSGVVPFEEIWGDQARLDYLGKHLKELLALGVYMVVITKGSGRVVDIALQLAGLRNYFQTVIDPKTSMGAKLMTLQVLMNTALGERLRPFEAALVDDELKNLSIDISQEDMEALPPSFHPVPNKTSNCNVSMDDFEKGHLVGPVSICRIMRAEQGVKSWQLRQLIDAARS